jgi:hypothetical protein
LAITVYCSKDEWAYKKAKTSWKDYEGTHPYPSANGLDDMLEEMTALMNVEMGRAEESNLTTRPTFLRNLCYRGVELMIDEEQGRATEEGRPMFIPRDYMYERDRIKLKRFGLEAGNFRFGAITSG